MPDSPHMVVFIHDNVPATGDDFRPSHRSIYAFDMPTKGEPWTAPEKLVELNRMRELLMASERFMPEVVPGFERYCGFARVRRMQGLHYILAIDLDEGRETETEAATPTRVTERVGGAKKLDLLTMNVSAGRVEEEGDADANRR